MINMQLNNPEAVTTLTETGKRMRWRDAQGVLHAVEGSRLVSEDPDTLCLWARCAGQSDKQELLPGSLDVPADAAWEENGEQVECRTCRAIESRGAL